MTIGIRAGIGVDGNIEERNSQEQSEDKNENQNDPNPNQKVYLE